MHRSALATVCALFGSLCFASPSGADSIMAVTLGLTPESAAVAGLSTTEASAVLTRLEDATALRAALEQENAAADAATQAVSHLASALASAAGSSQDIETAYQAALAQMQTCKEQVEAAREELFDEVTGDLSSAQVARLHAWRASVGRSVPASFRVIERTDEAWASIERALRAETRANRTGQDVAENHAQVLADVRGELEVVAAAVNLSNLLASMNAAFQSE